MGVRISLGIDKRHLGVAVGAAVLITAVAAPAASAATFKTERVSVAVGGGDPNDASSDPDINENGRFVVFDSEASNLIAKDKNGKTRDVFVYNRRQGKTRLISQKKGGKQGNGESHDPAISANGRFVAFWTAATNLVPGGDKNGVTADVLLKDRWTGKLELISKNTRGRQGNGRSIHPSISANGRYVAFESDATNLVKKDGNGKRDVFVHDRWTGRTILVSKSTTGGRGNGDSEDVIVSPDGRYYVYESDATNLVGSDPNGFRDAFLWDKLTKRTRIVSIGSRGNAASNDPTVSRNAGVILFETKATNLVTPDTNGDDDVLRRNFRNGKTTRAALTDSEKQPNAANGDGAEDADVSFNGRYLVWEDDSTNHASPKSNTADDVYWRNRRTGKTKLVSKSTGGAPSNKNESGAPAISGDGRFVVYESDATNLAGVPDTNDEQDIFVSGPMN